MAKRVLFDVMAGAEGSGLYVGGPEMAAVMAYAETSAGTAPEYDGLKKLDWLLRPDLGLYAASTGLWTDFASGRSLSPWSGTKPTLVADGGSAGRGHLLTGAGGNPGVLISALNTLEFREDTDQTFMIIIDPGATGAAGKAILMGDQYNLSPFLAISTSNRIQADFQVGIGTAVQSDANVVAAGRFWVVWYFWNATTRSLGVGLGEASQLASAVLPDSTDERIAYSRLCLFGGPERNTYEEPALDPGDLRVRLPAYNVKMELAAGFNADLRADADLQAAAVAWLRAEYPEALEPMS